ncbi:MAG: RlpA-like double-psi beta-barrel domain-containing protein [Solirubrobacterales bacterium]
MDERSFRRAAAGRDENRPRPGSLASRPDRIALWAVAMSVLAMLAGVASAQAGSSGGVDGGGVTAPGDDPAAGGSGSGSVAGGCAQTEFGTRTLRLGDCGDDVRTLNWILKSRRYSGGVRLADDFQKPTDQSVREFERRARLPVDGVVEKRTSAKLVRSMPRQTATWYGPGFRGNRTACGQRLKRSTVGVAHRSLPCGSRVVVRYKGSFLRTRVIDRGPYANGAKWDLTERAAEAVGLEATDKIRVAKIPKRR